MADIAFPNLTRTNRQSADDIRKALAPKSPKEKLEERIERHEKNMALRNEADKAAAKAERGEGPAQTDVVYEGFQDLDTYTADPKLDADDKFLGDLWRARKKLPVKQYRIRTDGTLVKDLTPAVLRAVKNRMWCVRCEQPQPENRLGHVSAFKNLRAMGVSVMGMAPEENCACCGSVLGFEGEDHGIEPYAGLTPDQQKLVDSLSQKAPE